MEREKLIKGLIYIIVIIILCTVSSRVLFKSGETLQEYAQNNPELAYAANESEEDDAEADIEISVNKKNDRNITNNISDGAIEESISPNRVTYQENFYYEPLSEELRFYITGISFPAESSVEISYDDLNYVHIMHYNFDGEVTEGELICNKAIAENLTEIFYELYTAEYQIDKIRLIDEYSGDDNLSMKDNNTSCFNYRVVEGSEKLSKHAYGLAIDINPFYNPYVRYNDDKSLHIEPEGSEVYADRSVSFPYKIDADDLCYKLFKEHGFTWGGDWNSLKDYQHFQKVID